VRTFIYIEQNPVKAGLTALGKKIKSIVIHSTKCGNRCYRMN
jgi:hypothetical protein